MKNVPASVRAVRRRGPGHRDGRFAARLGMTAGWVAVIKKAEGPIPDLRAPKGHIALDVPESVILKGALFFALVVLIVGRILRGPRSLPPHATEPPVVLARRALAAVGDDAPAGDCEQIVRRYLFKAFGAGLEGATARELAAEFAAHPLSDEPTREALASFLLEGELARFTPASASETPAAFRERAGELIDLLEGRRVRAEPPPLRIAT